MSFEDPGTRKWGGRDIIEETRETIMELKSLNRLKGAKSGDELGNEGLDSGVASCDIYIYI